MTKTNSLYKEKFRIHRPKNEDEFDVEDMFRDIIKNPAFKFVTMGLASVFLVRIAKKMEPQFPEISQFINENMDILNDKIKYLKGQLENPDITQKH